MKPVLFCAVLAAVTLAQSGAGRGSNPLAGDPKALEAGRTLFAETCSACHGVNGEGGLGPSLTDGREIRRASDAQLFQSVKKGVPGTDMPPFNLADDDVWRLVLFVRSLSAPAIETRVPGDPAAGGELFHGKAGCVKCHMIRGEGGYLGPDLTDAGARRSILQLREALLEPNKRLTDGFLPVEVTLPAGQQLKGIARSHTNYSLQLIDADGELHLIERKKGVDIRFAEKSPMPAYGQRLSPKEVDDVLAFLSRQSSRPVEGKNK